MRLSPVLTHTVTHKKGNKNKTLAIYQLYSFVYSPNKYFCRDLVQCQVVARNLDTTDNDRHTQDLLPKVSIYLHIFTPGMTLSNPTCINLNTLGHIAENVAL